MEDVLFGLAPPELRSTPQSQTQQQQQHFPSSPLTNSVSDGTFVKTEDEAESEMKECVAAQCSVPGGTPSADKDEEAVLYAGGSPCALPAVQSTPPPRTLAELRSMTSSDVREELERFFARKDAHAKHFKSVAAALLGGAAAVHKTGAAKASSAAVAGATPEEGCTSSTTRPTREELLARDRCRRLVNVSNWDASVGGYSQWDVLLPSALLHDCVMAPTDATAGQAAPASAASSERQSASSTVAPSRACRTLRPHQVEGIRFLWSVLAEGPVGQVPAVGCILAHTMGLGKTAQVIVFLHLFMAAFPRRQEKAASSSLLRRARALIVIPKSTQSGWKREFCTWSAYFPGEHRLHPISLDEGLPARQRVDMFHAWRRDGGVLLIGYEALVRLLRLVEEDSMLRPHSGVDGSAAGVEVDAGGNGAAQAAVHAFHLANHATTASPQQRRNELQARRSDEGGMTFGGDADPFTELVVCDEAHRLKSVHLHVVTALRGLHPLRRLLLTGTPLQNHLQEYWAMMDFCVHKYFSRKRFHEYFIQPIEASANTRASEKEVDLARKKTFTLINEVRHFVQRVDSTPLRMELPPLHEYIVVVPLSPLQKELYLRFIQMVQRDSSQKLQFLPAVSYSGKIAAHPQLLFQMREQLREAKGKATASSTQGVGAGGPGAQRSACGPHLAGAKRSSYGGSNYWDASTTAGGLRRPQQRRHRQEAGKQRMAGTADSTVGDDEGDTRVGEEQEAVVIIHSGADSTSSTSSDDGDDEEHAFARATQQSFSSVYPAASLTYEELCVPPSLNYTPLLEDGVKLLVAIKLVAAAMARDEKVLLFSLSTQLLTFLEHMIAKVNIEWRRPVAALQRQRHPQLSRPIRYCRLDGSHSAAQRAAMLEDFDRPDGPALFLLSTKAGGVGITVTAATRVILVDTSFNPADDQQAIGRAYRYGQTRPVYVYRLMCYPTLEYSIFVQKLAKEWLFKTVIEESSVKRDGLSGMHLRELFSLLMKAAKVLEKPLSATRAQALSTQEVLSEDPMLGVAQAELLYARRYEMFLEHDMDDRYGAAEEAFYHDYCRNRLFDTADDEDSEKRRAAELQKRRQQRIDEAAQLQMQSKTLTAMVDNLIRSRAGADSQLARLLTAMGLHVHPVTGRVQLKRGGADTLDPSGNGDDRRHAAAPLLLENSAERFAPSPVQLIGGADAYQVNEPLNPGTGTYAAHSTPQTAVLLLDSDEDSHGILAQPHAHEERSGAALSAAASAERISATLARQPYAPYRPGSSPAYAVDIDNDGSL
ncbi:putative helicase-like protein [Leishmania major strain Friedlin]|uniref:Putative helicase-like protein n=1 Tax=Leishmania major TaxID=5664 RepID=Q4QAM8_LEIMA|nr:putative helicase-like protein [Leishmania major strain Friedlin]CAG9574572.1 SNF2_family_protein [Leishmania major strain Friedlin]CAJ04698.1 putative helicase-like protein [Leishmania major strain Friedlin]|eukprot:XP_001683620.1 putative helicase-like protein [Leishmania major strain Friedlin]